ncbi:MAG: EAL domain-containing protein [Candidatus Sedimenticola sp. PURPLELP]
MLNDLEIIEVSKGSVIFREGDDGDCAYLVESGLVEISMNDGGKQVFLGSVTPGELLGEMAIIDNQPRSAMATAVEDARLHVIRRDQIKDRVEQLDPALKHIFQLMAYRFRDNLDSVRSNSRPPAKPGHFIDPELKGRAVEKLRLEADLWAAVDRGQLSVYYQPIISLDGSGLDGFEALLRWEHPERGMVMPGLFICLAEETPLIEGIGELVIEQVAKDYSRMQQVLEDHGDRRQSPFYVGVNVSAKQIDSLSRFHRIADIVNRENLPSEAIKLEITESQLVDTGPVMKWVREAKSHGYRVAIDDFGTGYSSLSHLLHLNADTIKIDRTFVRDLLQHQQAESMVRAIVSIARSFEMDIVAEGIETESQLEQLTQLGCDYGQGFLIGHPMPFDDLPQWMDSRIKLP